MSISNIDPELEVIKSNELSMSVLDLDLNEYRVLETSIGLYAINGNPSIRFNIMEMMGALDKKSRSIYTVGERLTDGLMAKYIRVQGNIRGKKQWIKQSLVKRCGYDDGMIDIVFDEEALYLLSSKQGKGIQGGETRYKLADGGSFNSYAATRLFSAFATNAFKGSYRDSVDNLKKMLKSPNAREFKMYGHFKAKILKPSIKKISDSGVFVVTEFIEHKEGRKVVEVEFVLEDNRTLPIRLGAPGAEGAEGAEGLASLTEEKLVDLLIENGFTSKITAKSFIPKAQKKADDKGITIEELIISNIEYQQHQIKKDGRPRNGGYLRKGILIDYAEEIRGEKKGILEKLDRQRERERNKERKEELEGLINQIDVKVRDKHITAIINQTKLLSAEKVVIVLLFFGT